MDCLIKRGNIFVEVVKPALVNIGGQTVTEAFGIFLEDILGLDLHQRFKATYPEEYLELLDTFEGKKRSLSLLSPGEKINLHLPQSLNEFLEKEGNDLVNLIAASKYQESVTYQKYRHMLRIPDSTFEKVIFSDVIDCIIKHVEHFIDVNRLRDVEIMVLVGGFAEYRILQSEIKKTFPQKRIHIPVNSEMATLKGGVLFGHYYAVSKRS